jgi:uncharacterized protein (TIGR00156 family)
MKKLFLFAFIFLAISTAALCKEVLDNQNNCINIKDVIKMKDNSYITIQGNIIKKISDDKYILKDSTGTMIVEIDEEKLKGININQNNKVELTGELEKDFNGIMLDVDSIRHILP